MIKRFQQFISKNALFDEKDIVLVAVSGGADSVVLSHLFYQSAFKFAIAHCNFQLRGKESDADETFVKQLAAKFKVPFHSRKFDTMDYSVAKNISIQMAAREIRYAWFEELRKKNNYHVVAIAHHRDDETETFFINLIRGTGIAGLHGIKVKGGNIVRPLLFAERQEIEAYARKNKILFREDSSNRSLKYLRNRIRIQLMPMLRDLNPQVDTTIREDIQKIKLLEDVVMDIVQEKRNDIMIKDGVHLKMEVKKLRSLKSNIFFLYEFLRPYGFSGDIIENIAKSLDSAEGKKFLSSTHLLFKDRQYLWLSPIKDNSDKQMYFVRKNSHTIDELHLAFRQNTIKDGFLIDRNPNIGMFDFDKLTFPLSIRKWKSGDTFYPFGMKGKKKLSDFFTDRKLSRIEKENIWLLCNLNDIIWIIGHRIDDRYKVTRKTQKAFIAQLNSK